MTGILFFLKVDHIFKAKKKKAQIRISFYYIKFICGDYILFEKRDGKQGNLYFILLVEHDYC